MSKNETAWEIPAALRKAVLARMDVEKPGKCLSFERLEELAFQPDRWTDPEREHVTACRLCGRLTTAALRSHPSAWTLLLERLGLAGEGERRLVEYHRAGECAVCREADVLGRGAAWLTAPLPAGGRIQRGENAARPAPRADAPWAVADTGPLEVRFESQDGRLEIDFSEDEDRLFLDVRSRDGSFCGSLVGYELRNSSRETVAAGFLVLHAGLAGSCGAAVEIDPALRERFRTEGLPNLLVEPVKLDQLDAEQRKRLPGAVAAAAKEQTAEGTQHGIRLAAWQDWAWREREAPERSEDDRSVLDEVLAAVKEHVG